MNWIANIKMNSLQCANCSIVFAVTAQFMQARRDDHREFKCPDGHVNYYPGESDEEKLTRQLEEKTNCCTRLKSTVKHQDYSLRNHKGQITKLKKGTVK